MNPAVEIVETFLQVSAVFLPRHPVHARRCLAFQFEIAGPQQFRIDVMQQAVNRIALSRFAASRTPNNPMPRFPGTESGE